MAVSIGVVRTVVGAVAEECLISNPIVPASSLAATIAPPVTVPGLAVGVQVFKDIVSPAGPKEALTYST